MIIKTLDKNLLDYKLGKEKSTKFLVNKKNDIYNYIDSYNEVKIELNSNKNQVQEFTSLKNFMIVFV